MATFERETTVDAPLSRVWAFHSTVDGLDALTPDWLDLAVEEIRWPGERPTDGVLVAGTLLRLSVRPLGVGPRRRWVSEIIRRETGDGWAAFRDEMRQGPFREWRHTHRFASTVDGGTRIRDSVEYETTLGPAADAAAWPAMALAFADRHRRTRRLLE